MKILSESEEIVVNMQAELTDEEGLVLLGYAMTNIVHDHPALINYAVGRILREQIERSLAEQEAEEAEEAEAKKIKNRFKNGLGKVCSLIGLNRTNRTVIDKVLGDKAEAVGQVKMDEEDQYKDFCQPLCASVSPEATDEVLKR